MKSKSSQKHLDHTQQSTTNTLKPLLKKAIKKIEKTGDLNGNKITDKIIKVSKASQENNSKTVTNEHDKEKPKERYMSPDEIQKTIDDLR